MKMIADDFVWDASKELMTATNTTGERKKFKKNC